MAPFLAERVESRLAQRLVYHDGGSVGEIERADAVIVGVDEVAADILGAQRDMVRRLAGALDPELSVGERCLVGQHGNALAAGGVARQELFGNA